MQLPHSFEACANISPNDPINQVATGRVRNCRSFIATVLRFAADTLDRKAWPAPPIFSSARSARSSELDAMLACARSGESWADSMDAGVSPSAAENSNLKEGR